MVSLLDIRHRFNGTIKLGEPLADASSLGIGGAADYVFAPSSRDDLVSVVAYLRESNIPFIFAGRGSNLLVSEQGYHGAVIMLEHGVSAIRLERTPAGDALLHAAAGARLASLVDFCVTHGLQGVEVLTGIPGTVAGLVVGSNAGAGRIAAERLANVELLRDSEIINVPDPRGKFVYRRTGIARDVVLGATFRLTPGNKEQLMRERRQALIRRNLEQPINVANAGIMFRDPPGGRAAELVQAAGLQGLKRGGAMVSERHANMMLNTGGSTVSDALGLLKQVQSIVKEKSGLQLEFAMRLVGFEQESMREVA